MMKRLILAAALCAASPAYGQSALEFAAAGMGSRPVAGNSGRQPGRMMKIIHALAGALALATNRTVVAIALVGLYLSAGFVSPASAQVSAPSALEYAAAGMGRSTMIAPPAINKRFARRLIRSESNLAGVYAPLAAKAREIEAACGSRVISGRRHTRVAGTRRWSLHASGHAVDMAGNPSCIYARLRGWSGGYSTDYRRVRHVHISLGGREDGIRFAHRGGRTRIAWR